MRAHGSGNPGVGAHHLLHGHMGVKKLIAEMKRRYVLPTNTNLLEAATEVKRKCNVCQACEPPTWQAKGPIDMTALIPAPMTSVCLDVFSPPATEWQGRKYDALLLCVDRLTGWIIALPTQKEGLTAEKAAHMMMEHGWNLFGIPQVITSDQGENFAGRWWKTMCARLGIRQAYSQAHRAQANGRAEVAGKTIYNLLRKLHTAEKLNWVEALPRVLRHHHNIVGECGASPYQALFGRERPEAG